MNKSGMEWTHLDLLLDFLHVLPSLLYLCIGQTKRACTFSGLNYSIPFLITEDLVQQPLEAHLTLSSKSSRSTSSKSIRRDGQRAQKSASTLHSLAQAAPLPGLPSLPLYLHNRGFVRTTSIAFARPAGSFLSLPGRRYTGLLKCRPCI